MKDIDSETVQAIAELKAAMGQVWKGIGISSENLPFVLQRFWLSDDSRHLRCDGIGLAITQRLVKVMGGQIEVESERSEGTTFKFSLPTISNVETQQLD